MKLALAVCLFIMICTAPILAYEIHDAARAGDLDQVIEILKEHPDFANLYDGAGFSPLHYAAMEGRILVMRHLLAMSAPVDTHRPGRATPLCYAVAYGQVEAVRLLISSGANVNAKDESGESLLALAVSRNCPTIAEMLISNGSVVNQSDSKGYTPLHHAARQNLRDVADLLLSKGARINAVTSRSGGSGLYAGDTPLHLAVAFNAGSVVELLVSRKADLNIRNRGGMTPLQYARTFKRDELYKYLKKRGAK